MNTDKPPKAVVGPWPTAVQHENYIEVAYRIAGVPTLQVCRVGITEVTPERQTA
jgi:hypothetical protein